MKPRHNNNSGFTFIELIVVVFVIAIGMAIAISAFQSATTTSHKVACRANMQTIGNEEQEYRYKSATRSYTTTLANLSSQSPVTPLCPDGGTYTMAISDGTATGQNGKTVPKGEIVITCSAAGHGKFAPSVDTN